MSTLKWRLADVTLNDKLVPNPQSASQLLDHLDNARVAVDGGFLHIDPRRNGEPSYPGQSTYSVHIVPAHLVRVVTYKEETPKEVPIEVTVY
ncbi:hypothetical protein ACFYOF_16855 [Streptomyces sp. NPDC007148]|uniref:hypothetical protein n=1 Tax=Streptomyces sp. NPDC007148 TaxID=3364775 RepID=UPI003687CE17